MPKVVPQYTDDAKRRIILSAMEAMAESGYENVTVDNVARKIGVTKGAVYWYFRSKNALLQEVLVTIEKELFQIGSDPYFNRPDTRQGPPDSDRLSFNEGTRRDLLSEIGLHKNHGDSIPEVTPKYIHDLESTLEKGIDREQKNGNICSPADPKTLALVLAVLCSGLQTGEIYAILFLARSDPRRIWFHAVKLFLKPEEIKKM